jgi:mannose-1-phosphate guanylyltransferase
MRADPRLNACGAMHESGEGMSRRRFKTAFILGAGLGMRLRPLTERCPKPLLEIGGRPIITYAMDHLLSIGVERFVVNTHHCPEVYLQKFPDRNWRGVPIIFRHESVLLDSAGGLKNIEDLLADDPTILCYNGDAISDLPLQGLLKLHTEKQPEVTMVLRSSGSPLNANINERGEICDLRHILKNPGVQTCFFASIYAVETSLLRHMDAGKIESIVPILIRRIIEKPGAVLGIVIDEGNWQSFDSVDDYEQLKIAANKEQ